MKQPTATQSKEPAETEPAQADKAQVNTVTNGSTVKNGSDNNTPDNNTPDTKAPVFEAKINDYEFMEALHKVFELHKFLAQEAQQIPEELFFNELRVLKYDKNGRSATEAEWQKLDRKNQGLFALLDDDQRRKYISQQLPPWFTIYAVRLIVAAVVTFILAVMTTTVNMFEFASDQSVIFVFYLFWILLLGALGSIASIGFNAIAVTNEITFDINNQKLLFLRLIMGALFAMVITLPIGFSVFIDFAHSINSAGTVGPLAKPNDLTEILKQASLFLLPFVLGYSTDLTIVVLNRVIDSIKALLGVKEGRTTAAKQNPPQVTPQAQGSTNK